MLLPTDVNPFCSRLLAVVLAVAAFAAGCSFLIDAGRDQCSSNSDCTDLGLSGTCESGVCIAPRASMSPSKPGDGEPMCDGDKCEMKTDAGTDAGKTMPPDDGKCARNADCASNERCFKNQCGLTRDVERFMCDPTMPAQSATVHFEMPVREFVSDMAPKGLKALACEVNDVSCANPVAMFADPDNTSDGVIKLELPYEFDGFLQVTASPDMLPGLWYFTRPLTESRVAKPLAAVAPATLELLAAIAGHAVMANRGLVIIEAFDCANIAVGGIHFEESKAAAIPFYIIDELPSIESTVTVRDEKNDIAAGGFLNASPGFTVFTARIGTTGPVLGEYNGHVRASTVTYLDIYP